VSSTTGFYLVWALATRAQVAIAQSGPEHAERDAHDALAMAAGLQAYLGISDILERLGTPAGDAGSHREAARLFGPAHGIHRVTARGGGRLSPVRSADRAIAQTRLLTRNGIRLVKRSSASTTSRTMNRA
jgi:hypothetical protein